MQYLLGLRKLGHEVYYLEDVGETAKTWNWDTKEWTIDPSWPSQYVQSCLEPVGLGDRWIYRVQDISRGMATDRFQEICAEADLFIMRAVPLWHWRTEYDLPRRRVFVDVDPGFTQFKLARGNAGLAAVLSRCDHLFTLAERINHPDCTIPTAGYHWHPTRPPVSVDHWPWADDGSADEFSTIMRWRGFHDVKYQGALYGQKDLEFPKFLELPTLSSERFCIAALGANFEPLSQAGWRVLEGHAATRTPTDYSSFIRQSRAEFSVAKQTYHVTRSGWFSDRSVCYLASGRPIVIQDTGLGDCVPTGKGIRCFRDVSEAVEAVTQISACYEEHRCDARQLAETTFNSDTLLPDLVDVASS
jgi:hypothetical protein